MDTNRGSGDPERIKVLRYQRIVEDADLSLQCRSCVPAGEFRRHLQLLENWGYTTITFNDYRLFRRGELNLPRRPVVLTFDGALLDHHRVVFPTLQRFGVTAVMFVHGDRHIKEDVCSSRAGIQLTPMMEQQQILEMHAAGIEIGSQGMTPANLISIQPDQALKEITRSRILLEVLLNAPVLSFAYPFGMFNNLVKRMVADAGYTIACATDSGASTFGVDPFEVRRASVKCGEGLFRFGLKLFAA